MIFVGASASTMLPSAEFVCLHVAYCEAFWEKLARLTWRERAIRRPLLFWVQVIFFHSLPSRVGCSFQGKFSNCFASFYFILSFFPHCLLFSSRTVYSLLLHLDPREKIASPKQDLFCSRKPLTYPGSASVQFGLYGRTGYPPLQALTFLT